MTCLNPMRAFAFVLLPLALLLLALPLAHAASFDCAKAHTVRESTVCSSPALSTLDSDLAKDYAAVRSQLTPASGALVQADQREWLAWLDKVCPANSPAVGKLTDCLTQNYKIRIDELTKGVQRQDGQLFYTRAHFVFVPGKAPTANDQRPPNDPGFGYGEFAWPQADAPNAEQSQWNRAVYEEAVKVETVSSNGVFSTLDSSIQPDGYSDGGFEVLKANAHFIEVRFVQSTYGWGAAHPNTGRATYLWSLDQHKAVTANDVLRPEAHWQTALIQPAIAKLTEANGAEGLWSGKELHDGVAGSLKEETSWILSKDGLTIAFAPYAVSSYARGSPEITFSWQELSEFLNPAFHPSDLPVVPHQAK